MTETTLGRVSRVRGVPAHQRLLAGVVANALEDCRAGDGQACCWLRNEGRDWLCWLLPDHADIEVVHQKVLTLAMPSGQAPARQMEFEQLFIMELEAST